MLLRACRLCTVSNITTFAPFRLVSNSDSHWTSAAIPNGRYIYIYVGSVLLPFLLNALWLEGKSSFSDADAIILDELFDCGGLSRAT